VTNVSIETTLAQLVGEIRRAATRLSRKAFAEEWRDAWRTRRRWKAQDVPRILALYVRAERPIPVSVTRNLIAALSKGAGRPALAPGQPAWWAILPEGTPGDRCRILRGSPVWRDLVAEAYAGEAMRLRETGKTRGISDTAEKNVADVLGVSQSIVHRDKAGITVTEPRARYLLDLKAYIEQGALQE
jgi:hypothetical protein